MSERVRHVRRPDISQLSTLQRYPATPPAGREGMQTSGDGDIQRSGRRGRRPESAGFAILCGWWCRDAAPACAERGVTGIYIPGCISL